MDAPTALRTFELANQMETTDDPALSVEQFRKEIESNDGIFRFDAAEQRRIVEEKPWQQDPNYFKSVKISAVALVKMVMHARSGGQLEVMGLMQGKVIGNSMVIMDAFALPVEGTETRVNAQQQANEYMVQYMDLIKSIDPMRTISAGRVEIGAFRTYPAAPTAHVRIAIACPRLESVARRFCQGTVAPDEAGQEYQTIPLSKIEDFGVHVRQYYPLEVTYFKSTTDRALLSLLWNQYWINVLSSDPLLSVADIGLKLEQSDSQTLHSRLGTMFGPSDEKRKERNTLTKVTRDSCKISQELLYGLMNQLVKRAVFEPSPSDLR